MTSGPAWHHQISIQKVPSLEIQQDVILDAKEMCLDLVSTQSIKGRAVIDSYGDPHTSWCRITMWLTVIPKPALYRTLSRLYSYDKFVLSE
jgi:hypothetical protein